MPIQKKELDAESLVHRIKHLIDVGISLSAERNTTLLLQKILDSAKKLTRADGGTLYTVTPSKMLRFEI